MPKVSRGKLLNVFGSGSGYGFGYGFGYGAGDGYATLIESSIQRRYSHVCPE
jgi:hypothetical protein